MWSSKIPNYWLANEFNTKIRGFSGGLAANCPKLRIVSTVVLDNGRVVLAGRGAMVTL